MFLILVQNAGCGGSGEAESRQNFNRAGPFYISTPSVSPDNLTIVYDSSLTGNGDIYRTTRIGTNVFRLTRTTNVEMHPIFSPDGKRIAFSRQSNG